MIKDITFGQYVFGRSVIHKLDPRFKMIYTIAFIVLLFVVKNLVGIAAALVITILLYILSGVPFKMVTKSLKPIWPLLIFTAVLNLFLIKGEVIWQWWRLSVTKEGIYFAIMLSLRLVSMFAISALLTYTTSPIELTEAIESLLSPLKWLKVPVGELAMIMSIALRFIPTLIEETDRIMSAQKSRGANIDTGKLTQRIKALVPILVPLFVSAFRRADELALAMECRCYRGGNGRTRLKQLKLHWRDGVAFVLFLAIFVGILSTNWYITAVI